MLQDLAAVLVSSEPEVALRAVPSWLLWCLLGGGLGLLLREDPRRILGATALAAVLSVAPIGSVLEWSRAQIWLPRAAFLFLAAYAATWWGSRRWRVSPGHMGLGLGLLLAGLVPLVRFGETEHQGWRLLFVGLAFVPLALLRPRLRVPLSVLLLIVPVRWVLRMQEGWQETLRPDLAPPATSAPLHSPSLILVVLDTVRADHLGSYGYARPTTPNLDAFAEQQATLFTQARSTSPFTAPSHASLFTGLLPGEHGSTHPRPDSQPLDLELTTLAEKLRDRGYQTAGILANGYYLNHVFDYDQGFEHYDDRKGALIHLAQPKHLLVPHLLGRMHGVGLSGHRDARSITDAALDWLDEQRRSGPFFLFLNYLDVHSPYTPEPPFDRLFEPAQPEDPRSPPIELWPLLYDRELRYLDHHVGRLLEGLERRDLVRGNLVVVTADHGEALGERGIPEHCWTLYENVVRVPLLVKPAAGRRVLRDEEPINGAELHHLILHELGLTDSPPARGGMIGEWYPSQDSFGLYAPLFERIGFDFRRSLIAWLEEGTKVIVADTGEVEAYDLRSDPDEASPLDLPEDRAAEALERAVRWWEEHPNQARAAAPLDEATLQGLRALGYAGDA